MMTFGFLFIYYQQLMINLDGQFKIIAIEHASALIKQSVLLVWEMQINFNYTIRQQSIIFISSMLDLLQLASDPSRHKIPQIQPSKEEIFNHLMSKLKQRNSINNVFIRKYIRQAAKWTNKCNQASKQLPKEKCVEIVKDGDNLETIEDSCKTIQKTEYANQDKTTQNEIVKVTLIQQTNHTEQASEDQNKISSFPVINYSAHVASACSQTKIRFQTLNPHLEISKFFKNFHSKQKEQTSKVLRDKQNHYVSPKKLNTEAFSSKYQLNIKSVVFDNESCTLQKKSSKDSLKGNFFSNQMIQKYRNLKKIEMNSQFHDDKIIRKGIFPNINTPSPKSQQFIENYMRSNNEKQKNRVTVKSITKQRQDKMMQVNPNRNVLSFRINTIQIKKQF